MSIVNFGTLAVSFKLKALAIDWRSLFHGILGGNYMFSDVAITPFPSKVADPPGSIEFPV